MRIMNDMMSDIFDKLVGEAVKLLRRKDTRIQPKTLTSLDFQAAVRFLVPGELCKHALQTASGAVEKYHNSRK